MKTIARPAVTGILAAFLCSCATSSIKSTWKSAQYQGGPIKKIAVLAEDERPEVRGPIEREFVAQLQAQGVAAFSTLPMLSLPEVKKQKAAASEQLRQAGADAVLVVRVASKVSRDNSVQVAPGNAGYGSDAWYDFAYFGYANMYTSYYNPKDYLYLDTSLFDLGTNKRIWSCLSQSVFGYDTDRYAAIKPLVAKVLVKMSMDGMIR